VSGRIVDLDGVPVSGAEVTVAGQSERSEFSRRGATTDADGRFTVAGLDGDPGVAEPYLLSVEADGFPRQYLGAAYRSDESEPVEVLRGQDTDVGQVALLDGIALSGVISGPDGPVSDGVVYAYASSQVVDVDIGADGVWSTTGLPPGDVLFWASADGLATTYYPGGDRPTSTRLPMPDEGAFTEDADLALPAESTVTFSFTGDGRFSELTGLLYNSDQTVGRGASVTREGALSIDALWPGAYTLVVYGDGSGFAEDWIRDEAGQVRVFEVDGPTTFEVALPTGAAIGGVVTDDAGEPVYGAAVQVFPTAGEGSWSAGSDADGGYEVSGMTGGLEVRVKGSYTPYCDDDPAYVTTWWPDARHEEAASTLGLDAAESDPGVDLVLARDFDHDAMADAWESEHGLDTTRDDADEDPDDDGYSNLDEYLLDTDPVAAEPGTGCGCGGGARTAALVPLLALLRRRRTDPARTRPDRFAGT
jgi:hypothetical protein